MYSDTGYVYRRRIPGNPFINLTFKFVNGYNFFGYFFLFRHWKLQY